MGREGAIGAAPAGDDGAAGSGQVAQQLEQAPPLLGIEGLQVVQHQQGPVAGQGMAHQARPVLRCGPRDVVEAQGQAQLVEQLVVVVNPVIAECLRPVGPQFTALGGDPELERKVLGRRTVRRLDGQGGLAHTARPVQHHAPAAVFRQQVLRDLFQARLAAEKSAPRWQRGMRGRPGSCGGVLRAWRAADQTGLRAKRRTAARQFARGESIRRGAAIVQQVGVVMVWHIAPWAGLLGSRQRPEAQCRLVALEVDPARGIAMGALLGGRLAELVHAEDRAALDEPHGLGAAAPARIADVVFVLVAEALHRKASGGRDFGVTVLTRLRCQPVRPLVGEQQADIVLLAPDVDTSRTQRMQLPSLPDPAPLVVAARQLPKGRVQPDDADAARSAGQRGGEVSGQQAVVDAAGFAWCGLPPRAVGGKDVVHDPAVGACRLVPELVLDTLEAASQQQAICRRIVIAGVGPEQIVIAGHRQQHGIARTQFGQLLPQRRQHLSLEPGEFVRLARLHQIVGEEHRVPGAAAVMQRLQAVEKGRAQRGPEMALSLQAIVEIGEVQPGERVCRHGGVSLGGNKV